MQQVAVRTSEPQTPEIFGPMDEPGFRFTATGLKIQPWVKFDEWTEYGRKLQIADRGIQWAIGDWLIHGENHWPDKYDQAVEFTGYREGTLMNYATVARAIPGGDNSRRREFVDYSTHVEVASLAPDDQEKILAKAAKENLSRNTVRREAEKIKREGKPKPKETDYVLSQEARTCLDDYMNELGRLEETIPPHCPSLWLMMHKHGRDALWQRNRTVATDCKAIVEMFSGQEGTEGTDRATVSDIRAWLEKVGYFMDDLDVSDRLDLMVEKNMLEVKSVDDSRQDGRRGVMIDLYALHPDYEAQLDNAA